MRDIVATSQRIVYRNRWMRVREDAIRRPDGSTGIYGVVEKPDFAVIAPIEQGVVYLVQQYRYPVGGRYWELPQGSWETKPDAEPLALARAELKEETGLSAAEMRPIGHLFQGYGYATQGYTVFLASGLTRGAQDLATEEQDLLCRPFALADVEAMIANGTIKDATTVAAFGLLWVKQLL